MAEFADQRESIGASGPTASPRLKTVWWSIRSTSTRHDFPDESCLPDKLYRGQLRPWHHSCLYPCGGFLREVSQWLTLREGNLHVHHGACDHLPQCSGPWDLHD